MSEHNNVHDVAPVPDAREIEGFGYDADRRLPSLTLRALALVLRNAGMEARVLGADETCVEGMSIDSRAVEPGNLFVCKGAAFRPAFLEGALAAGAVAYLCEGVGSELGVPSELLAVSPLTPAIVVSDVRRAMALAAPAIYGNPERALHIVGITGTKGKSTVAYMLRAILDADGISSSILGSIETDDGSMCVESHNTTPEAPDLWRHLHNTLLAGREHMVMEVSSQGLKYDRVLGLPLEIGCFLNIGRDHISGVEHPNFEDYFSSKLRIFDQCETAVVNARTEHADRVLAAARHARSVMTFAVDRPDSPASDLPISPDYLASDITPSSRGLAFDVREVSTGAVERIELGMPGLFNVDNALAALVMARILGVGFDAIRGGLAHVRVPGRMELVPSADGRILAIVDYAHNELSFRTLFESVKEEYPGRRIIALFGAPGGKAQERREALPRVASRYADHLIYTEEDPAHERVEDICAELVAHTPDGVSCEVVPNRENAVARAFEIAREGDGPAAVLLLAKGDEETMHRGDEYPTVKSDLALARELLAV